MYKTNFIYYVMYVYYILTIHYKMYMDFIVKVLKVQICLLGFPHVSNLICPIKNIKSSDKSLLQNKVYAIILKCQLLHK